MQDVPFVRPLCRWPALATLLVAVTMPPALSGQVAQTTTDPAVEIDLLGPMVTRV